MKDEVDEMESKVESLEMQIMCLRQETEALNENAISGEKERMQQELAQLREDLDAFKTVNEELVLKQRAAITPFSLTESDISCVDNAKGLETELSSKTLQQTESERFIVLETSLKESQNCLANVKEQLVSRQQLADRLISEKQQRDLEDLKTKMTKDETEDKIQKTNEQLFLVLQEKEKTISQLREELIKEQEKEEEQTIDLLSSIKKLEVEISIMKEDRCLLATQLQNYITRCELLKNEKVNLDEEVNKLRCKLLSVATETDTVVLQKFEALEHQIKELKLSEESTRKELELSNNAKLLNKEKKKKKKTKTDDETDQLIDADRTRETNVDENDQSDHHEQQQRILLLTKEEQKKTLLAGQRNRDVSVCV